MPAHPIFVLVEVEGEDATMAQIHPGDTYVIEWAMTIEPGTWRVPERRVRHVRITVPQEGVKPPAEPSWARGELEKTQP